MEFPYKSFILLISLSLFVALFIDQAFSATTRRFQFNLEWMNVTHLCHTKELLTVNGQYPGPTISVHEGDNVQIKVTNRVSTNTSIHWHGIRQLRTAWADGPAYITQCPIKAGGSYTYDFTVSDQRGTLWWHSHLSWQRASVYGAFIIIPKIPFPFSVPIQDEIPIIFGDWYNQDIAAIEDDMIKYGGISNLSDAYTINGLPGSVYNCSVKDTFVHTVEHGKTYMLRIINAATNNEFFFTVADHLLTVVEIDAVYIKPFTTTAIMITPGQTTNVLLTANQVTGMFLMAARPYFFAVVPVNKSTTIGFLKYKNIKSQKLKIPIVSSAQLPLTLPRIMDTDFATKFVSRLRSLDSAEYPCNVPKKVDKRVIITTSVNLQDCPAHETCKGAFGKKFYSSMNNQSFLLPPVSILEYHYHNITNSFYSKSFPEKPPHVFNYTGVDPLTGNMNTEFSTKLLAVAYGTKLEMVFQNTKFMDGQNHPIHIHGHNFFVVGTGFGNFDEKKDPRRYNLVDPPERNTVGVNLGGWAAIRINADNPGVWFIHCHLEDHLVWGLSMGLIVENGRKPSQSLPPPPPDLPSC